MVLVVVCSRVVVGNTGDVSGNPPHCPGVLCLGWRGGGLGWPMTCFDTGMLPDLVVQESDSGVSRLPQAGHPTGCTRDTDRERVGEAEAWQTGNTHQIFVLANSLVDMTPYLPAAQASQKLLSFATFQNL